eukprot:Opistho-2@51298
MKELDGDWKCAAPACGASNFARRSDCHKCGILKPVAKLVQGGTVGKDIAEKSKGLFSADDWTCGKCGNINWQRRRTCNQCNHPRHAKQEERTGFGGGFNERQGVEYKDRVESDDEYDEFGRKKKKFRGSAAVQAEDRSVGRESNRSGSDGGGTGERRSGGSVSRRDGDDSTGGNDDDDDDDEDVDLSKYQLDEPDEPA